MIDTTLCSTSKWSCKRYLKRAKKNYKKKYSFSEAHSRKCFLTKKTKDLTEVFPRVPAEYWDALDKKTWTTSGNCLER